MFFLLAFLYFGSLSMSAGYSVGVGCKDDPANPCPIKDGCVKDGTTYICICRLAHKDAGGTWKPGFERCDDGYSPWSLYPYENGAAVAEPDFSWEQVPDSKLTDQKDSSTPAYSHIHQSYKPGQDWCATGSNTYLQIDLGAKSIVNMIGTQGIGALGKISETFDIAYSDDGTTFTTIAHTFGHIDKDSKTVNYNIFSPPVNAQFIRIIPLTKQKCVRFELYGNKVFDECTDPTWNQCSTDAVCTDTLAGYSCQCNSGYDDQNGDGFICDPIDECKDTQLNNCSQFSDCTDVLGGFTCKCWDGYLGDGYYCEDIDECEIALSPLCHADALCVNTPGTYHCECNPGFKGDDPAVECEDINECKTGDAMCHVDASCTNLPGSFNCECYLGYKGNGTFCADQNECADSPCHVDGQCRNTKGSYVCKCKDGFEGNGRWCDDIDECKRSMDGCGADEQCHNNRGSFECICPRIMPYQRQYKALERTILDHVLTEFRNVTNEDWKYPLDYHAHIVRTIYHMVMRTYNYHYLEARDPFYIAKVAGESFGIELYDLRCRDAANVSFPALCHAGYRSTEFYWFSDIVEMWLAGKTEVSFENWATVPTPTAPNPNDPTTTLPPILTERPLTEKIVTDANGTNITLTESPTTMIPSYTNCGWLYDAAVERPTEFSSPNHPELYPPMTDCVWELRAPDRMNVYVSFETEDFEMELDKKCSYDYIEVRDGSINGDLLAKYCGTVKYQYPKAVRSTRESLFVIFRTDRYYQYKGFKAKWGTLEPRVSIGCIIYNQMSTMPESYREKWLADNELEDKSTYVPVSRLLACRQYPQCNNSRPGPIVFTFEHFRTDRNDKVCIRWDLDAIGATYSTNGCKKRKTNKTHTVCECYRWGVVGVLGRLTLERVPHKNILFELGKNSFLSVLFVVFALIATLLYLFLKDQWGSVIVQVFTKSEYDSGRIIQLHIVLSTLLAEIFFSTITFSVEASAGSCFFLVFLFYYWLQSVFFWLFIYTLFLQSRIREIFDSDKFNSYKIYLFVGYGVPLLVTLTIAGLGFRSNLNEKLCWLMFEGTTVWGFSGVIVTLGTGTLILLISIIYNAHGMENGLILQEKCLKTMFTVFFVLLSSAFGATAIRTQKFYAEYLFALCNLLQGFSIAIMYCILRREDPIIKANQVGPIPNFKPGEVFDESDSDGDSDVEERKDMSEAPTSSDEEAVQNDDDADKEEGQRTSAVLLTIKSNYDDEVDTVDEPIFSSDSENEADETDSEEDNEIMFRSDEIIR